MSAYEELLKLKLQNKLDLIVVIAPPRTGSTMLQSVLSKSHSIDIGINDPQGQEEGYSQIVDEAKKILIHKPVATILVKEMSHWIHANKEYRKIFDLARKIVISIRNPLLSTESRLKKFIDSLVIKPMPMVFEWLLKSQGHDQGMNISLKNQRDLLDKYAIKKGYADWKTLIEISYKKQNYTDFEDLLTADNSPTGFTPDQLGWAAVDEEVIYLQKIGETPILVDSTDLRLAPEITTLELCKTLNIEFNSMMIEGWNSEDFSHLITESSMEDKAVQSLWYDSISQSNKIKAPNEVSPRLSAFPDQIKDYLRTVALPAYIYLYKSEYRVQGKEDTYLQIKSIDPIYYLITKNLDLSIDDLLKLVVSG